MTVLDAFSLLGGVGLFLYGMTLMSAGLRNAAGDRLRLILERATSNRVMAVLVGILVTLMIQSSSATDVMVIGFVNSGLMTLSQAIGVIMGANIGTTITAQLTAFDLSAYAPLILFVGAVMYLFFSKTFVRDVGSIILGFGMLFVGISIMKSAIAPLSESEAFIDLMSNLHNPFLAILFGVAFTALLQSSSSSTVIFQAFAVQGILDYQTAVYLVIGAAVGSVTPNLLASLTANRNGKRTAILNLVFNLIRAVLLTALITIFPQILTAIQSLSPDNVGRQIANTHTIFAIIAVVVEFWFAPMIVKLAQTIIPVLPEETRKAREQQLIYINHFTSIPAAVALSNAKLEIVRMGHFALQNLTTAIKCFFADDYDRLQEVIDGEDTVDYLDHNITMALVELRSYRLSDKDRTRLTKLLLDVADIERISDYAVNLTEYAEKLRDRKGTISQEGLDDLQLMAKATLDSVQCSLEVFSMDSYENLDLVDELEQKVDHLQDSCTSRHVERLMNGQCEAFGGVIYSDFITDLERCADHAYNVAYSLSGRDEDDEEV